MKVSLSNSNILFLRTNFRRLKRKVSCGWCDGVSWHKSFDPASSKIMTKGTGSLGINKPRDIQEFAWGWTCQVLPCILYLWTCLNSPQHYKGIPLSIPLNNTGTTQMMAQDNTNEGVITLSNQVSETLNRAMSICNEVPYMLRTNCIVPELQLGISAESYSKVKIISLKEAMK